MKTFQTKAVVEISDWPLPENISAAFTTRVGGVSVAPFASFNLATHVGDDVASVSKNRALLKQLACLPDEPQWLEQQHTDIAVNLADLSGHETPIADASWTNQAGKVAVVMTADCLPILVAAQDGSLVAAIHAGWKGLADGIVIKTIQQLPTEIEKLTAWIGPAISQDHFEVGEDVYQAFLQQSQDYQGYFKKSSNQAGKYYADLPSIAEEQMKQLGVASVYKSGLCSFAMENNFFSYRRDGQTGRMASLIWIKETL